MLTTEDNPFDPWTQYDLWREWDISHGYNLESYIATLIPMLTSASIEDRRSLTMLFKSMEKTRCRRLSPLERLRRRPPCVT